MYDRFDHKRHMLFWSIVLNKQINHAMYKNAQMPKCPKNKKS